MLSKSIAFIVLCFAIGANAHGKQALSPRIPALPKSTPLADVEYPVEPRLVQLCLPGFSPTMEGDCGKNVNIPAMPGCDAGSITEEGCRVVVPPLGRCPAGYKFKNDTCTRTVEASTQYYCPKGYFDDGVACATSIPSETALQCDLGQLVGDQCVYTERKEHIIKAECPEGSQLEKDGGCWKVIDTFDCTDPIPQEKHIIGSVKQQTSVGEKVVVSKARPKLRSLHGKGEHHTPTFVESPPVRPQEEVGCPKEMITVSGPRASKIGIASKTCSKKIQIEALIIVSCPEGFSDNGEFCTKDTVNAPTILCITGRSENGSCLPSIKRVPKYAGCPKGGFSARGKCWVDDIKTPESFCPKGYRECGDGCEGFLDTPLLECPEGLELVGDRCIGLLRKAPISLTLEPELQEESC